MEIINDRHLRIDAFQRATGTVISTAIAYLEAEEFDVADAVSSYKADVAAARKKYFCE